MRLQTLKEARWIFLVLLVLTAVSAEFSFWLAVPWIVLTLFTISFFRDPDRPAPTDPGLVVAAADGRVVAIEVLPEDEVIKAPMQRVAIFLSVIIALSALLFVHNLLTEGLRFFTGKIFAFLLCGTLVLALGIYDDIRGAGATLKFAMLGAVAVLFYALGGRIVLRSNLGDGSTFTLTIPADAPQ